MAADFYALQAEVLAARHPQSPPAAKQKPAPKQQSIFVVCAWDGERWALRRDTGLQEFSDREAAEKHAENLPRMWTHRTIVEIKLG